MADLRFPEINQVALCGRLTADPEARVTEEGKFRLTFNVAVNLRYRDRNNNWKQDTTFVPVSIWNRSAEYAAEKLHKGSGVFLTGRLRSRTFETSHGNRTVLEVVARHIQCLDKKVEPVQESDGNPSF